MATSEDTIRSISQLAINESPELEDGHSFLFSQKPTDTPDQLSGNVNEEKGGFSSWRTSRDLNDMELSDDSLIVAPEEVIGGIGSSHDEGTRDMVFNELDSECRSWNFMLADKTVSETRREDRIDISDNFGTVIVKLGQERAANARFSNDTDESTSLCSSTAQTSFFDMAYSSTNSLEFRRNLDQAPSFLGRGSNRLETKRNQRPLQQTKINRFFRQRKRRTNLKSVSRQNILVKEGHKPDTPVVNINVINNSGNVFIGDEVTCHSSGSSEPEGCCLLSEDGTSRDLVEADGDNNMRMMPATRGPVIYIDKTIARWLAKFYRIVNEIYPLRDNGKWQEFYEKVDAGLHFARVNNLHEEEILLTIEKSVALSYQKNDAKSKKMIKKAREMILTRPGLHMREFLIAMAHCQLTSIYRRANKLPKANSAISIAAQNVEFVPSALARTFVIYEKASNWFVQRCYYPQLDQNNRVCTEEAKKEFKNCITASEQMLSEDVDIYLRRHHFCLVKLAFLDLNVNTAKAREEPVTEDSISEAGHCISRMRGRYGEEMGESTNMLLCSAESGYFYRRGDYVNAVESAQQALHKAESLGFQLEIQELRERLNELTVRKRQQEFGGESHHDK